VIDETLGIIIAAAGLVFFVVLLAVVRPWIERKRTETVRGFAHERGFSFHAKERNEFWKRVVDLLAGADLLFGRIKNVVRGTWRGRELIGCDLSWRQPRTSATRRRPAFRMANEDNYLSICLCCLERRFPAFAVNEKGPLGGLLEGFGSDPLEFEPEELRKQFHVSSKDPDFARKVLHPQMIAWLLEHPGWSLALTEDLLIALDGNRWTPGEYLEALDVATGFLDRIPESVWEEYRERAEV